METAAEALLNFTVVDNMSDGAKGTSLDLFGTGTQTFGL